jgi:hypothetical protein
LNVLTLMIYHQNIIKDLFLTDFFIILLAICITKNR